MYRIISRESEDGYRWTVLANFNNLKDAEDYLNQLEEDDPYYQYEFKIVKATSNNK